MSYLLSDSNRKSTISKILFFVLPYIISALLVLIVAYLFMPASTRLIISLSLMMGGSIHITKFFAVEIISLIRELKANGLEFLQYSEDGDNDNTSSPNHSSLSLLLNTAILLLGFCVLSLK